MDKRAVAVFDLTTIRGRQHAGLPEIMPVDWLNMPSDKTARLREVVDIDFTSSTGIAVGKVVSPWPAIAAALAVVQSEHVNITRTVNDMRRSAENLRSMPDLHKEALRSLQEAEMALLRSSTRLPSTTARTQEAMQVVADHLYETGVVVRPGVERRPDTPDFDL
jgi:hypothetical protein